MSRQYSWGGFTVVASGLEYGATSDRCGRSHATSLRTTRAGLPGWEGVIDAATGNCRIRAGEAPAGWDTARPTY